jgi:hypothetical protein
MWKIHLRRTLERTKIVSPHRQVSAITADQHKEIVASSIIAGHYEKAVDRESAFEKLKDRAGQKVEAAGAPAAAPGASVPEGAKPSFFDTVVSVFNLRLDRVGVSTIRWRHQWPKALCVLRAVRWDDKSCAEF